MAYDAIIVGAGPAGATTALVLAQAGRRVLLLDAGAPTGCRPGESLPPAAGPLLRDLGLLPAFLAAAHHPSFGNVSVWGDSQPRASDFIRSPYGSGWQLDRTRFDADLRAAAQAAGVELQVGRIRRPVRDRDGWQITTPGGVVSGRWLVDATGRRARIAPHLGAQVVAEDKQVAFYGQLAAPDPCDDHDTRTLVEACAQGWWYTALVPGGRRMVVFLTDTDLVEREILTPHGFMQQLGRTQFIGPKLAGYGYQLVAAPRGVAAMSTRLSQATGEGWLAVGDAAVAFDPLSSQGVMTALYTGMLAGQRLHAHLAGDAQALPAYEARISALWDAFAANRTDIYAVERRWAEALFWRRRHTQRTAVASLVAE